MLRPGWLKRQTKNAAKNLKSWPEWMQREAQRSILGMERRPEGGGSVCGKNEISGEAHQNCARNDQN